VSGYIPMLKHFTAFNVEQIDGIEIPDAPKHDPDAVPFEPLAEAVRIIEGYQKGSEYYWNRKSG